MDASYKIQRGIHVHLIQFFMCPEFWVHIKTVCTALPEVAEQVVIFIKDTDGDLAEEYMGDRIGSRHRFEKLNEFETKLV